jgi:hypothetical protein
MIPYAHHPRHITSENKSKNRNPFAGENRFKIRKEINEGGVDKERLIICQSSVIAESE